MEVEFCLVFNIVVKEIYNIRRLKIKKVDMEFCVNNFGKNIVLWIIFENKSLSCWEEKEVFLSMLIFYLFGKIIFWFN